MGAAPAMSPKAGKLAGLGRWGAPRRGSPVPHHRRCSLPTGRPRCGRRCPHSGGKNMRCASSPPFTASPSMSWMRTRSGMGGPAAERWGLGVGTPRLVALAACVLSPIVDTGESTRAMLAWALGHKWVKLFPEVAFQLAAKGGCSVGTDTPWWLQPRTPGCCFHPPKHTVGAVPPKAWWSG